MRTLLAMLALALLGGVLSGCGSANDHKGAAAGHLAAAGSHAGNVERSYPLTQHPGKRLPMSAYEPPTHLPLRGDGDRDGSMWDDGYRSPDNDEDARLDSRPDDSHEGYRDADDLDSLRVGIPETPANTRAIEALVRRYYAVAATGDGAKACAMMTRGFARAVPVDYGRFGPSYLHGGKTCAQIVALEFKHDRSLIATAIEFTAVHEENPHRANALFGSMTTPASFIGVEREGGAWKVAALLGRPLP